MCGFCGFVNFQVNLSENLNRENIQKMLNQINFRGPDKSNTWDYKNRVFFGHNRLSILDISEQGDQPMSSHDNRLVIVYNGEIYNHIQLRKQIENRKKIDWRGTSDTETILEYISIFGLQQSLESFKGMFSFVLFDKKLNKLFLSRDTMGEKPLYYGYNSNLFFFGSDLQSFFASKNFIPEIDYSSLSLFLKYGFISEPNSILKNIFKLKKKSYLELDLNSREIISKEYKFKTKKNFQFVEMINEDKVLSDFESLLYKSVESQLISDVGFGCFLSGGIDSTLITTIANNQSKEKINTFSVGFQNPEYDESHQSRKISKILKTNHHEFILKNNEIEEAIFNTSNAFSEPFADSSQIPTMLLSKFSRYKNKVVLTGDGADELFGGYNRYSFVNFFSTYIKKIPFFIRKKIGYALKNGEKKSIKTTLKLINLFLIKNKQTEIDSRLDKFIELFLSSDENELYFNLLNNNSSYKKILDLPNVKMIKNKDYDLKFDWSSEYMKRDLDNYLNNDILVKLDRSSMYYSLEARAPYLDQDLVNFSEHLPLKFKIRRGEKKYILKKLIKKILPSYNLDYPKKGFSFPLNQIFKRDLKKYCLDLFSQNVFYEDNFLKKKDVMNLFSEHYSNKKDNSSILWNLFTYFSWKKKYKI